MVSEVGYTTRITRNIEEDYKKHLHCFDSLTENLRYE